MKQKTDSQIAREWEKDYWSDYYPLCKKCKHSCKQSHKILGLNCKKFELIEESHLKEK